MAHAEATNIRDAARDYKIEESTIRAWVKKLKEGDGFDDSRVIPAKKSYFQQKYSEQVSTLLVPSKISFNVFMYSV